MHVFMSVSSCSVWIIDNYKVGRLLARWVTCVSSPCMDGQYICMTILAPRNALPPLSWILSVLGWAYPQNCTCKITYLRKFTCSHSLYKFSRCVVSTMCHACMLLMVEYCGHWYTYIHAGFRIKIAWSRKLYLCHCAKCNYAIMTIRFQAPVRIDGRLLILQRGGG